MVPNSSGQTELFVENSFDDDDDDDDDVLKIPTNIFTFFKQCIIHCVTFSQM